MSMIICKECGKEISDQAPNCPNCGVVIKKSVPNQKKKDSTLSLLSAILVLVGCTSFIGFILALVDLNKNDDEHKHTGSKFAVAMFVIYCIVTFLMFFSGSSNDTTNNQEVVSTQTTQEDTSETTQENVNESVDNSGGFEVNGLKVTIDNYNPNYNDYSDEYNILSPNAGYKYIKVDFTYENNSESDKYVSIYDYECYADGTLCEQVYYFDEDFTNANISTNRNVSFSTYYTVPIDSQNIELEYTSNVWTGEKKIIKLN